MYAKIFTQIFDSSIANDWQVRHVFEDLLKLCDRDGVVDMTVEAVSRRTAVPLEIVRNGIKKLMEADKESRSKAENGSRIVCIDEERGWGWKIVNYSRYRSIMSEEGRRESNRLAQQRQREKRKKVKAVKNVATYEEKRQEREGLEEGKPS